MKILLFLGLMMLGMLGVQAQSAHSSRALRQLNQAKVEALQNLAQALERSSQALQSAQAESNDSVYVEALLLSAELRALQGLKPEALQLYEHGREVADSLGYQSAACRSVLEMGYLHYSMGAYDHASTFFEEGLEMAQIHGLETEKARALNLLGKYHHTKGDFHRSVGYYKQAAEVSLALDDVAQSAALQLNIGKNYIAEGNIYKALSSYLQAYDWSLKSDNLLLKSDVINHLGSLYLMLKQPEKSLEYHREALRLRTLMQVPQDRASSHNNLGETFLFLHRYDSARVHIEQSLALCQQVNYRKGTIKAMTNLGRVHNGFQQWSEAQTLLHRALQWAQQSGYDAGIVESALALGQSFLGQKRYAEAVSNFELSLDRMQRAHITEFRVDAFEGLYRASKSLGNTAKALEMHEAYAQAMYAKLQAESDNRLAELRVRFDLERKENDNLLLRQENDLKQLALNKRNWMLASVGGLLVFLLVFLVLIYNRYVQKQRAHVQLQQLNRKLELAHVEKDKMFSIIAHELRNPLYWFQNLAEAVSRNHAQMSEEKLRKSLYAIDESAKHAFHLMDNLLNWSRTRLNRITPRKGNLQLRPLVDEAMDMFGSIVKQKEIETVLEVDAQTVVFADSEMLGCVVRNLISNAIKYTPVQGRIEVHAQVEGLFCVVSVINSGGGISTEQAQQLFRPDRFESSPGLMQEKGSGLGLKVSKEFAQLNGGEIWVEPHVQNQTCFRFSVSLGGG
jgi:signal transduction histidine kinase